MLVGEEEREEEGKGMAQAAPQREGGSWVHCLRAFISLLQVGILGEVSGEGFNRIFISFPGVLFQGCALY